MLKREREREGGRERDEYGYDELYDADTPHNQVYCVFVYVCIRERVGEGERDGYRYGELYDADTPHN